jgi:hypothetical protein
LRGKDICVIVLILGYICGFLCLNTNFPVKYYIYNIFDVMLV